MKQTYGELIRTARKRRGFSQLELAQRIGMSRNYVSLIENDQTPMLTLRTTKNLARYLLIDELELIQACSDTYSEVWNEN